MKGHAMFFFFFFFFRGLMTEATTSFNIPR